MRMFIVENRIKAVEQFHRETGHPDYLVSYHYLTPQMHKRISAMTGVNYLLDSGAFSAYTQGITIDNRQYLNFALNNRATFWRIFALDDIGSAEKSLSNYDEGKTIIPDLIPCFHKGEPWEYLDHYCQSSDYLAIGGLVAQGATKHRLIKWLDVCWGKLEKYWPIKVHLFGLTSPWAMMRYPAYSVDSTSARKYSAYGRYLKHEMFTLKSLGGRNSGDLSLTHVRNLVPENRVQHNMEVMRALLDQCNEIWDKRGIKWD